MEQEKTDMNVRGGMMMKILSVGMIVTCGALYQTCSRRIPASMNPFSSLILVYSAALATAVILFLATGRFIPSDGLMAELHKTNAAPLLLGMVVSMYELGFLLAYRSGFQVSQLSPITTVLGLGAALLVGTLIFREQVTLKMLIGLAVAIAGILIMKL
jgi:drug/metabolite transporter (DMT)-like permease